MSYRELVLMECFDDRKCFAKTVEPNGRQFCLRLAGKPYKPGTCPYCKESIEDKGERKDAGSCEKNAGAPAGR